jgi:hypothetical protein
MPPENDTIWQAMKAEIKDRGGSLSFELIKALATKLAAKHMGL